MNFKNWCLIIMLLIVSMIFGTKLVNAAPILGDTYGNSSQNSTFIAQIKWLTGKNNYNSYCGMYDTIVGWNGTQVRLYNISSGIYSEVWSNTAANLSTLEGQNPRVACDEANMTIYGISGNSINETAFGYYNFSDNTTDYLVNHSSPPVASNSPGAMFIDSHGVIHTISMGTAAGTVNQTHLYLNTTESGAVWTLGTDYCYAATGVTPQAAVGVSYDSIEDAAYIMVIANITTLIPANSGSLYQLVRYNVNNDSCDIFANITRVEGPYCAQSPPLAMINNKIFIGGTEDTTGGSNNFTMMFDRVSQTWTDNISFGGEMFKFTRGSYEYIPTGNVKYINGTNTAYGIGIAKSSTDNSIANIYLISDENGDVSLPALPAMCSPTVNVDWIITDAQTCSTDQDIGTGNVVINTGGTLTLISNADVTANSIQLNVNGDSVFINSGSELRVAA